MYFATIEEAAVYYLAQIRDAGHKLVVYGTRQGYHDYDIYCIAGQYETTNTYPEGYQTKPEVISAEQVLETLRTLLQQDDKLGYRLQADATVSPMG